MRHFEDEDREDDFEIEFADLPEDKADTVSGRMVAQSALWLVKLQSLSRTLATSTSHLPVQVSRWLMTEAPSKHIVEADENGDFELEIADLPPDEQAAPVRSLAPWRESFARKTRLRRLVILSCTLLLLLSLILGEFPTARDWTYKLLVHAPPIPTPAPTPAIFSSVKISRVQIEPLNGVVTGMDTSASGGWSIVYAKNGSNPPGSDVPGQMLLCQLSSTTNNARIGAFPVWVSNFDDHFAILHMLPTTVPVHAFASGVGWQVDVQVEIDERYSGPITLSGSQDNGTPFLFSLVPSGQLLTSITLDTRHPIVKPGARPVPYDHKTAWNVSLYFPAAGCYSLDAKWPGGNWHATFAVIM
ncbi:MAG: hypothetical protein ACJ788_27525 [Ktedonobacteraceae bacterium]